MPTTTRQKFDWQSILQLSLLTTYQVDAVLHSSWLKVGYDFVFELPQATLVMLVNEITLISPTLEVKKSVLAKSKQQAVSQLLKRHQKLLKKHTAQQKKRSKASDRQDTLSTEKQVYFIGITLLTVDYEQQPYPIPHQYGGLYFQEECVIDLDEDMPVMQVFSLHSLLRLSEILQTPSDFLAYIRLHRHAIAQQVPFDNEEKLATDFISSPQLFEPTKFNPEQSLPMNLTSAHNQPIPQLGIEQSTENRQILLNKMQQYSAIWIELIQEWVEQHNQIQRQLPLDILRLLLFPSLYTRMQIIEAVFKHSESTAQQKQHGYVCDIYGYQESDCHYFALIYGLDSHSPLSKNNVATHFEEILLDMSTKYSVMPTQDLVLLGFDLSHPSPSGDIEIAMNVYHHSVEATTSIDML